MTETPTTPTQTPTAPVPPQTQTEPTRATTPILAPIAQVFQENAETFKAAGIAVNSLSEQAPEGATIATEGALNSLSSEQQKAVKKAQTEGYYISVAGQTFAPTKEGVARRQAREALTTAAQNGGIETLAKAGLWNKDTNMPEGIERVHPATKDNENVSSSDEDDKKAEALLSGFRVEGNWWERNKDWAQPLLIALAGTALGFALAHIFKSKDGNTSDLANVLIDKSLNTSKNENQQTQENANTSSNTGNVTPTPTQTQTQTTLRTAGTDITPTPAEPSQPTQAPQRISHSLSGARK